MGPKDFRWIVRPSVIEQMFSEIPQLPNPVVPMKDPNKFDD